MAGQRGQPVVDRPCTCSGICSAPERVSWRAVLLAATLCSVSGTQAPSAGLTVPACEGQKIGIIDIGSFAESHGFPTCDYSEVAVNPSNGIVYTASERKHMKDNGSDHEIGTHAAPWYLREAIKSSKYYTDHLDEADIVYVDDYCYYIWWLGVVHTYGRNLKETPGDHLLKGYKALMETPKWRRKQGQNYVFYDSHPGFMAGDAARPVQQIKCFEIRKSVHLVVDTPMRYVCGGGWPYNKLFVTPYHPNRLDITKPAAHLEEPSPPLSQRTLLTYHRATCAKLTITVNNYNAGKVIRRYLAAIYAKEAQDVQVKCTNHDHTTAKGGAKGVDFKTMFKHMQSTVFCLVLAGDAASTRRFSEIMMAGCIPTFVGPPYHSMPFVEDVDYRDAAIFFNVTNYSAWLETPMQHALDPKQKALHETEGRWWVPDADISGRVISVAKAEDIIDRLRTFPVEEAKRKLELMSRLRTYFSFDTVLTEPPNAVNVLMSGICKRAPLEPQTA